MKHFQSDTWSYFLALLSVLFYGSFAYDLVREDFWKLISLYGALFFLFYKLIQFNKNRLPFLIVLAVVFRLVLFWATPNLSQDYFRFIWDGRMIAEGLNPYLSLPGDWVASNTFPISQTKALYDGMGVLNGSHYTVYPPINQFVFALAAWLSPHRIWGAILVMKTTLLLSDLGILYFGYKLLRELKLPPYKIFWYVLNPFVIIEMTGNLHFESMMIFFLTLSLYLIQTGKWRWAAVFFGFSASVKLITMLFLPIFIKYFKLKKALFFYVIVLFSFLVLYLPFMSVSLIEAYTKSLNLYFSNFEFNASLYNIARWIGFEAKGYNMIRTFGKYTPFLVISMVIIIAFFRKNRHFQEVMTSLLFAITGYYLMATTVHPWYIALPLLLALFTKYRYALIWSFVVMLSYFTYANPNFIESPWILWLEYSILYGVFFYEIWKSKEAKNTTWAA
ncbi:MAG: mannosyltransferase [Bacteroidetes bacterium]|nr:mannosyltransferase [Bacteroidota bacterium]